MIYHVLIPLGLLIVPWLLVRYVFATDQTRHLPYTQGVWHLWLASALWVASQLLPDVAISPETDTFTMHFVGGIVAAVLYVYAVQSYQVQFVRTWQLWIGLYLFASALGVLNELFEFFADKVGIIPLPPSTTATDTWWDLVANTLGSFLALAIIKIVWHNLSTRTRSSADKSVGFRNQRS